MTETLAIRLTADADDAARAFDGVGDAAARMASDVDTATRDTDAAASRLDGAADAADNMASRSSQAAGGIGDLGGALAMMGGPLGAVGMGMEAVAPAIMGVTGAADLMNLAMTSNIVTQTKARAAAIATRTATIAQAVATRTAAVAQRVLNAAMRANPIGLVVAAVMLLVGAVVLAYKRSETFRRIVDKAMAVAKAGVMAVIRVVGQLVGWVRDKLGAAWVWMKTRAVAQWNAVRALVSTVASKVVGFLQAARDKITAVWQAVRDRAGAAWDWVKDKVRGVVDSIKSTVDGIRSKVADVGDKVRSALGGAFDWVLDKVQPIIDAVQWIIDKLNNIKLPNLPGRLLGRETTPGAEGTRVPSTAATPTVVNHITITGVLTERDAGRELSKVLNRHAATMGYRAVVHR